MGGGGEGEGRIGGSPCRCLSLYVTPVVLVKNFLYAKLHNQGFFQDFPRGGKNQHS